MIKVKAIYISVQWEFLGNVNIKAIMAITCTKGFPAKNKLAPLKHTHTLKKLSCKKKLAPE